MGSWSHRPLNIGIGGALSTAMVLLNAAEPVTTVPLPHVRRLGVGDLQLARPNGAPWIRTD